MEKIVLDTSVMIDHVRNKTDTLEELLILQDNQQTTLIAPVIVVYEYYSGLSLEDSGVFEETESLFLSFVTQDITDAIAKKAAELNRRLKLAGKIETNDLLIGATCLSLGAKLATGNRKHYRLIPGIQFYQ